MKFCKEAQKSLDKGFPVVGTEGINIIKYFPDGHKEIIGKVKPDILVTEKEIIIKQ